MKIAEMNYRAAMVRLEENVEMIAFYDAHEIEKYGILDWYQAKYRANWGMNFWANVRWSWIWLHNVGAENMPYIFMSSRIFNDNLKFGDLVQMIHCMNVISRVIRLPFLEMHNIIRLDIVIDRLFELLDVCETTLTENGIDRVQSHFFETDDLTFSNPKGEILCESLTMKLSANQCLLIEGPSGCGKSSFLRTVAGLWSFGRGNISTPAADNGTMFLPQNTYMPCVPDSENTLRRQCLFPNHWQSDISNERIIHVLKEVNLGHLVSQGLDALQKWDLVLSIGENQRVAFARVILSKCKLVFLDEATSAMDEENQRKMYFLMKKYGIDYISIGHDKKLREFHNVLLSCASPENWEFKINK